MAKQYRYHAFISYRHQDPDRTFARELVARLEAAGLTIAIDERDFQPQETFLEEMERCIRESRFTLAVLSPRYQESGNTNEEAVIAKVLDMGERRRRLIPLVLEEVERPVWMYDIVGIDFSAADPLVDPHERLLACLRGEAPPRAGDPSTSVPPKKQLAPDHVTLSRLPVTGEHFVRREKELERLDEAWEDPRTHLISVVAWGGVGKSALVNRWLTGMEQDRFRGGERVYG